VKIRRYSIKSKEAKHLLIEVSQRFDYNFDSLLSSKPKVEIVETTAETIFLIEGKPLFFKRLDIVVPTLFFTEFLSILPRVIVDMGAVPYVCKGANIMVPGIVKIEGEFEKSELVLIVDEKHAKSLALGLSLFSSNEIRSMKKGVVIKSIHFVSDKIWDMAKTLFEK
jgi:PUA domain protein